MANNKKEKGIIAPVAKISNLSSEDLITTEEVAKLFSVSIQSVHKWAEAMNY